MIYIETLARKLLPELCGNQALSIICLSTSNPVYLVFIEASHSPDLVVRFSPSEDICQTHRTTERLYKILGDLIPEPLALIKDHKQNISIQKGVTGSPWFQLTEKYASPTEQEGIHTRAINALNQLHQALSSSSDWVKAIRPGDELRQSYQQCIISGSALPADTENLVIKYSKHLDDIGEISSISQHGDFCINNLIIDDSNIHIIDFEDFGITFMPFHDQFTLALSLYQSAPESARITLSHAISCCIDSKSFTLAALDKHLLPGLFMNHLLLRLGSWSEARTEYRQWLLSILKNFNASPEAFFHDTNLTKN